MKKREKTNATEVKNPQLLELVLEQMFERIKDKDERLLLEDSVRGPGLILGLGIGKLEINTRGKVMVSYKGHRFHGYDLTKRINDAPARSQFEKAINYLQQESELDGSEKLVAHGKVQGYGWYSTEV